MEIPEAGDLGGAIASGGWFCFLDMGVLYLWCQGVAATKLTKANGWLTEINLVGILFVCFRRKYPSLN